MGTPGNTAADIFYSDFDTTFSIYADASVLGLTDDADVDAADIGPAAKGACYEPPEGEARCVEVTLRQCKDAGWWYDGDDTECALPTDIPKIGACCHGEPRGSLCTVNTRAWCVGNGGAYRGDDSICKEDLNNDGIFDTCEAIPAASEWGLAILMLLTMVLGTIAIRRHSLAAPGV